jgi:hypothetical protein
MHTTTMTATPAPGARHARYWRDRENVLAELQRRLAEHGLLGVISTQEQLRRDGYASVVAALDLQDNRAAKPGGYWHTPANLKRELLAFIAEHGTPGVMPEGQASQAAQRRDLVLAIGRHGGPRAVARRLGLTIAAQSGGTGGNIHAEPRSRVRDRSPGRQTGAYAP